jgi:hypothetical protein
MIKSIHATIEGISPLLMHAYPMVPIEALEKKSPEVQSEHAAYRHPETKELFIPGDAFQRALIGGASYSKGKGRATLAKPVAACLLIPNRYLSLGVKTYEIDARPVVIPSTGGRIIRYRPILRTWKFDVELQFDDDLLKPDQVRRVVDDTGRNVGLLDFRPEKKGPFGRFQVTHWEVEGGNT